MNKDNKTKTELQITGNEQWVACRERGEAEGKK